MSVFICLKYDDVENKNFEGILVSEVRGKFEKKKWPKAETKGKLCIFLSSLNLVVCRCCRQVQSSNIIQNIEELLKLIIPTPKNNGKPTTLLATPRNTLNSLFFWHAHLTYFYVSRGHFQYWRSTCNDVLRQQNGKLEVHGVLTRWKGR